MKGTHYSVFILCVVGCALCFFVLGVYSAAAQPPPPDDPNSAPIDGGLGILMVAGAGLGLKKAWDARCSGSGDSSHPDAS